jgi:type II secretion system protein C
MMDKAQLGNWRSEVSNWGHRRKNAELFWVLRVAAMVLALLACLYAVGHLLVLLGSDGDVGDDEPLVQIADSAQNPAAQLNADTVVGWGWSNDLQAGSVEPTTAQPIQENVKQTRLQMRLEGIVKAGKKSDSVAIIEIDNQSKRYRAGDKLPVAAGVVLRSIDVDRIILDNNGSLEELLLFTENMLQQRRSSALEPEEEPTGLIDQTSNDEVTAMMGSYLEQITQNPGSVSQLMKFSVHTQDGKLAGFKIGAAGNPEDFSRLGLEDGDIVTHVNGVDLSDYRKAMSLYNEMQDLSEVRVQLVRQGQPQELIFRLPGKG